MQHHSFISDIEKTLSRFDHVISYYNVSKEVDPIIRNGKQLMFVNVTDN